MNVDPWLGSRYTSSKKCRFKIDSSLHKFVWNECRSMVRNTLHFQKKENLTLKLTCVFMRTKGV